MGERLFGELLEELDERYPNRPVSINKLIKSGFSHEVIKQSIEGEIITLPLNMKEYTKRALDGDKTLPVLLGPNGFMMLNQIRQKKSTDELNQSIKKFEKSSSEYSQKMSKLTWTMLLLAIFTLIMNGLIIYLTFFRI